MTQQRADYPLDYAQGPAPAGKDRMGEMADKAAEQLETVADRAQDLAGKVVEQGREYGEMAQDAARSFKPYVESSMKEQPMATLAVAAAIGFALGALWKK